MLIKSWSQSVHSHSNHLVFHRMSFRTRLNFQNFQFQFLSFDLGTLRRRTEVSQVPVLDLLVNGDIPKRAKLAHCCNPKFVINGQSAGRLGTAVVTGII